MCLLTDKQIDELSRINFQYMKGSITVDEAILQLRGGGKVKDISWIIVYIWLFNLQNNQVHGFQQILPPHQEWIYKRANQRPPHVGSSGSFSRKSSLGLANTNNEF